MFYDSIPKVSKGAMVVSNPLDALGDNQILGKTGAGFTDINLPKLTFDAVEAKKIQHG